MNLVHVHKCNARAHVLIRSSNFRFWNVLQRLTCTCGYTFYQKDKLYQVKKRHTITILPDQEIR